MSNVQFDENKCPDIIEISEPEFVKPNRGMVHEAMKIDECHVKNKVIGMMTQPMPVITFGTISTTAGFRIRAAV